MKQNKKPQSLYDFAVETYQQAIAADQHGSEEEAFIIIMKALYRAAMNPDDFDKNIF